MPKTVIYDPKLDPLKPRSSMVAPVESISSPIRFPRILNRGTKKAALEAVETKGGWIHPGTNLNIPDEDFDYISKHPVGADLISSGAIKVFEPLVEEGKILTDTSRDYLEPHALELIRNSSDLDWLERSERKEDRPAVLRILLEQIKSIKSLNAKG